MRGEGRQIFISTGRDLSLDDELPDGKDEADREVSTPGGEEQRITGFSADSRRRLRSKMHTIRRDAEGVFLTLTYQHTDPTCREAKRHLDTFWKRLRRWLEEDGVGRISCVWKMEPQERGTPHFHLIVYGVSFINAQKVSRLWHEVTDEVDHRHRKAGVDVERAVNEDGKLQAYLAKYLAKTYDHWPGPQDLTYTGRWWGIMGRDHVPWAQWDETAVQVHQKEAERLIRDLLDEWEVDIPDDVIPPTLTVNTRGDPSKRFLEFVNRI